MYQKYWYMMVRVPKYSGTHSSVYQNTYYFRISSVYKFVYQFFNTYCTVYQKVCVFFGTRCNMYHFFGTRAPVYQKYPCTKIFWYISLLFLVHHQYVLKFWYILWYIFWFLVHGDFVTIYLQIHEFLWKWIDNLPNRGTPVRTYWKPNSFQNLGAMSAPNSWILQDLSWCRAPLWCMSRSI